MALTVESSGSQTATISTEHTLATITSVGIFQLKIDTKNLVNDEIVVIRIKTKVLTGGAVGTYLEKAYKHIQGEAIKCSIPVSSSFSVAFTLQQTAGTGRVFDWAVERIA